LPLPDRNLLIVGDEPTSANCRDGLRYIWIFDVREPSNPISISTMPTPSEADYCAKGGNFGAHNLHENRPGAFQSSRLIFATYYNAGVRGLRHRQSIPAARVGFYVPPDPERMIDPRPNRPQVIQSADCYVDRNGLMYLTIPTPASTSWNSREPDHAIVIALGVAVIAVVAIAHVASTQDVLKLAIVAEITGRRSALGDDVAATASSWPWRTSTGRRDHGTPPGDLRPGHSVGSPDLVA